MKEDRRLRRIEMASQRMTVLFLAILTLIALGMVLRSGRGVVLPLLLAMLLSNIFVPFVRRTKARGIPPILTISVILSLFVGICLLAVLSINARVVALAQAFPRYYARLLSLVQSLANDFDLPVHFWEGLNLGDKAAAYLLNLSGSAVSLLSNLVLVIIFMVFILLGSPYFTYKLRKAFSLSGAERIDHIIDGISSQISRYLLTQTLISAGTGLLVWFFLAFFVGVDFPITWGLLAFFLNFIPTIGSIVASMPPILFALVQFYPDWGPFVTASLGLLLIQFVMGNLLTPKLMGDRLNLSPVVVLISLLLWGWLWGVAGALLSVPITAVVKIICENVEALTPLSALMGSGRSYQREFEKDAPS